jgi:hypothetical protein
MFTCSPNLPGTINKHANYNTLMGRDSTLKDHKVTLSHPNHPRHICRLRRTLHQAPNLSRENVDQGGETYDRFLSAYLKGQSPGKKNVGSVKDMTRRIRMVILNQWFLVRSVAEVVSHNYINSIWCEGDLGIHHLGHPSCMELGEVSDVVRSYPWRCIECKICEICQEKGDDVCST